jgi:hypothetical protein
MNLAALQHLLRAAVHLAEDRQFLVLGSASLLATYPFLGDAGRPLSITYDADLLPEPFEELTAVMLDEALGSGRAYFLRHGYHADILRDSIVRTFPTGWRDRLVQVPDTPALALDPHDLAAIKVLVGRPKDLSLVEALLNEKLIDHTLLSQRAALLEISVENRPRLDARLGHLRSL